MKGCKIPIALFFILFFATLCVQAQTGSIVISSIPEDPKLFDLWALEQKENLELLEKPGTIGGAILNRLKRNVFTSDSIILKSIEWYYTYDKNLVYNSLATIYDDSLFTAIPYINELQELMYGRENLSFSIRLKKIEIIRNNMCHVCDRVLEYETVIPILEAIDRRLEIKRIEFLNALAYQKETQNKIDEADELYRKVLVFPYFRLNDEKYVNIAFDTYIAAGYGIIRCRKDNLKLLERTNFFIGTRGILDPVKEEAIQRLKN